MVEEFFNYFFSSHGFGFLALSRFKCYITIIVDRGCVALDSFFHTYVGMPTVYLHFKKVHVSKDQFLLSTPSLHQSRRNRKKVKDTCPLSPKYGKVGKKYIINKNYNHISNRNIIKCVHVFYCCRSRYNIIGKNQIKSHI